MIEVRQASFLVVEDSAVTRRVIVGMLRQIGAVHIDEADCGEAALKKLGQTDYTLILSDWNMAPIDGQDLLKFVVARQKPRANRFIFITSDGSWGRKTSAKIDGADDFIIKPFDIDTLQRKILSVLKRG